MSIELEKRFEKCWKNFCKEYKQKGPANTDKETIKKSYSRFRPSWARIFENKHFWTERDIVRTLSNFCEKEFKEGAVHNETPIDHMFFENCEKSERFYIDIDIIDPNNYENGIELREKHPHDIFAEVKWISKGMWPRDITKYIEEKIPWDGGKLRKTILKNRVKLAYICIVNDEPNEVERLFHVSLLDKAKVWAKEYSPVKELICC